MIARNPPLTESRILAVSRWVRAWNAPRDQPRPICPESFPAPRMVVADGASSNCPGARLKLEMSWGSRPTRRVYTNPSSPKNGLLESGKRKMSVPSTKKGRFSGKKLSNPVRFTTAGSASTWPKSGVTVASSVSPLVSPTLRSPPVRIVEREAS